MNITRVLQVPKPKDPWRASAMLILERLYSIDPLDLMDGACISRSSAERGGYWVSQYFDTFHIVLSRIADVDLVYDLVEPRKSTDDN